MTTIPEIAAKLTEAQRKAIKIAPIDWSTGLSCGITRRMEKTLIDLGLLERSRKLVPNWVSWKLSETGLAVRAHLQGLRP